MIREKAFTVMIKSILETTDGECNFLKKQAHNISTLIIKYRVIEEPCNPMAFKNIIPFTIGVPVRLRLFLNSLHGISFIELQEPIET